MKCSRTWKWENVWLVFSVIGVLIVPWAMAFGLVPRLVRVYESVPPTAFFAPVIFGLLWGFAQVTFGISLRRVGVALTLAVVSGLASLSGSLVPLLVFHPQDLFRPRGILLLASIPLLIVGLIFYSWAGRRREREQADASGQISDPGASFSTGLALCIFTGVFGSSFNLGFAFGGDVIRASLRAGAGPLTSTYSVWAIVLGAGFIPNLAYCIYLLVKNRTAGLFRHSGWTREATIPIVMGLVWAAAILSYGLGATIVGAYGTSVGYMLFTTSSVLFANAFGILAGEWRNTSVRTRKLLIPAIAFILIAVVVLNAGGMF